jgi:hypothetical protein
VCTMPSNVALKVESVVATVSNGSGSAVTPELTIKDAAGTVIATKRQASSIPAGDTGTATFALRLADDGGASAAGFVPNGTNSTDNYTGFCNPGLLSNSFDWQFNSGPGLLDLTDPYNPVVKTPGVYSVINRIEQTAFGGSASNYLQVDVPEGVNSPILWDWAQTTRVNNTWAYRLYPTVQFYDATTPLHLQIPPDIAPGFSTPCRHDSIVTRIT